MRQVIASVLGVYLQQCCKHCRADALKAVVGGAKQICSAYDEVAAMDDAANCSPDPDHNHLH